MSLAHLLTDVNWLAVLAALVAAFVLGGAWYSKALFGNAWMQDVGLTEEAIKNGNMARTFGGTIILDDYYKPGEEGFGCNFLEDMGEVIDTGDRYVNGHVCLLKVQK